MLDDEILPSWYPRNCNRTGGCAPTFTSER
jgi:hypothetical protein